MGVPEGVEVGGADREQRAPLPVPEGGIAYPDPTDRPSRTILTGEGGSSPRASSTWSRRATGASVV